MDYRRLGTTGLKVSRLGAGLRELRRDRLRARVLRHGRERGGGLRADGPRLGGGHQLLRHRRRLRRRTSETFIGRWLKAKGPACAISSWSAPRCSTRWARAPTTAASRAGTSCGRSTPACAGCRPTGSTCTSSTSRIPRRRLDETLRALDDLVRAGKVLYLGASNIEAWRLARALWISDSVAPGALRVGAELLQPARPHAGARGLPALRRPGAGLHRLQPAGRRLAHRQVPRRQPVPRGLADDPSARAVPPGEAATFRARCLRGGGPRARRRDEHAGAGLGPPPSADDGRRHPRTETPGAPGAGSRGSRGNAIHGEAAGSRPSSPILDHDLPGLARRGRPRGNARSGRRTTAHRDASSGGRLDATTRLFEPRGSGGRFRVDG